MTSLKANWRPGERWTADAANALAARVNNHDSRLDDLEDGLAGGQWEQYANLAAFPTTGETAKEYLALDSGKLYRWSGSAYVAISFRDVITPEQYGAVGNGTADDTVALNNCFAAAGGKTVYLTPGKTYKHTNILTIGQDYTKVDGQGAILLATVETASEVLVAGKYCTITGLTVKLAASTTRYSEYEKQKLRVAGDWCTLTNVVIDTSSAAGIYTMAGYFVYINVLVKNTKADGFFTSEGAHDGVIFACTAENPGDDGFSVVSYAGTPCHHIVNIGSRVINGGARGFSVVGGHHIEYLSPQVEGCKSAGIYIGAEGNGYEHITYVTVDGAVLYAPNTDAAVGADDHGGIMITSWDARNVQYVNITGAVVRDVPSGRAANARIIRYNTSTITDIAIDATFINGPTAVIDLVSVTQTANNIYLDLTRNGVPYNAGRAMCRLNTSYTLTSSTAVQKLFNSSANGAVKLPVGVYRFVCQYSLSGMSATSGNSAFSIAAGSAAVSGFLMSALGVDGDTATAAALNGSTAVTSAFPASQHTAGTGTAQQTLIQGTFKVTTEGTIIPSIALATAAAAVVAAGSYFECWQIADSSSAAAVGAWS